MKASRALVISVFVASTVAFSSADRHVSFHHRANKVKSVNSEGALAGKEKYAPRFDGLRFIETLVTAHR